MTFGIEYLGNPLETIHEVWVQAGALDGERQKSSESSDKCCACLNPMKTFLSGRVFHVKKIQGCYEQEVLHAIFCSKRCAIEYFCKAGNDKCPVCRSDFTVIPVELLQSSSNQRASVLDVLRNVRHQELGLSPDRVTREIERQLQANTVSAAVDTPRGQRSFGGDRSNTLLAATSTPRTPKKEILQHTRKVRDSLNTFTQSPQSFSEEKIKDLCSDLEDFSKLSPDTFGEAFLFAVEHKNQKITFQILESLAKAHQGNEKLARGVLAKNKIESYPPEAQNCIRKLFCSSCDDESE